MVQRREGGGEEVVGHRSRDGDILLRVRDRGGFDRADPDRQESITTDLTQDDHRVVVDLVDPDADDIERKHTFTLLPAVGG